MKSILRFRGRPIVALAVLMAAACSSTRAELPQEAAEAGAPAAWDDGFDPSHSYWDAGENPDADGPAPFVEGPVRVFAFGSTTCALLPGKVLKCWGQNAYGLVGNRDAEERDVIDPTVVEGVAPTTVAGGTDHVCASDGATVWCWGKSEYGVLGRAPDGGTDIVCKDGKRCSLAPLSVAGLSGVRQIASGTDFSCALLNDATVRCWGKNDVGQLGTLPDAGTFDSCSGTPCASTPVTVPGLANVAQISLGATAACARMATGEVSCWGRLYDFVRNAVRYVAPATPPTLVPDAQATLDIALGAGHACVVYGTSAVGCMGTNLQLQVLYYSGMWALPQLTPKPAKEAPFGFRRLALGGSHSCGLMNDRVVYCWGASSDSQVSDACVNPAGNAVLFPFFEATDVSAGLAHTCIARANGEVYCRGRNDHGQLGGEIVGPLQCHDPARAGHTQRRVTGLL